MGNAVSKGANVRKLPKTQSKEIPKAMDSLNRLRTPQSEEGEQKEENSAAFKDGQDPDFSANLSRIDPVKVEKMQTQFKPSDKMVSILRGRRVENEMENAAMAFNRLSATSLLAYLEERRQSQDVSNLNTSFQVKDEDMDAISKYTAAPRLGTPFKVKVDEERGEIERVKVFL